MLHALKVYNHEKWCDAETSKDFDRKLKLRLRTRPVHRVSAYSESSAILWDFPHLFLSTHISMYCGIVSVFQKSTNMNQLFWLLSTNLVMYCIHGIRVCFPGIASPCLYTDCPDQHVKLLKCSAFILREVMSGNIIRGSYLFRMEFSAMVYYTQYSG